MVEASSSSSSQPSESKPTASGASKFLSNLPSRGLLSSSVLSSSMGGLRIYVTDRPTSPPEAQVIKTNPTNILIRSLTLRKQKGDPSAKDAKLTSADGSRKRASEKALEGRSKRAVNGAQTSGHQESSNPGQSVKDFQNLTVERLRALLREKGLPVKGKKDELIARLRGVNG